MAMFRIYSFLVVLVVVATAFEEGHVLGLPKIQTHVELLSRMRHLVDRLKEHNFDR